ncbi:hypothetical protein C0995_012874 [Termitomyces sp. Mi166|nr:hypothetical protein C0995_012874 [Termitomyces sp. Mi166\
MYTTSSLFLKSLADAGITHAFVNWGSDHPALLEDLERQRIEGDGKTKPEIVTCPNEMVALSAAQGYAQVTGKPAAVIVHVDVGTQALAGAIHNVDRGRTPVLIYAGASAFSAHKELKGARNEWIMWMQDIPDQSAINRQYMRYSAQISSGSTVSQYVARALQVATSDPKGPVYLWARREVMEQEVPAPSKSLNFQQWSAIEPSGLSPAAASHIASALLTSRYPLIITSFLGRNPNAVPALTALSTLLSIPVVSTCPSAVNFPFSHPFSAGVSFLAPGMHTTHLPAAETILVIDCDLPWIPANNAPSPDARVFVLDGGDPIKTSTGFWHVGAEMVCRADAEQALEQILEVVKKGDVQGRTLDDPVVNKEVVTRGMSLKVRHQEMVRELDKAEEAYPEVSSAGGVPVASITVPNILGVLRKVIERASSSHGHALRTLFLNESISNYQTVWTHLRPEVSGSVIGSGGSSLGWALGAAVGAHIGAEVKEKKEEKGYDLIVAIVGDGSYMFGVPSSAYWMARKYQTSPRQSMLGVHPDGYGSKATGEKLTVGFGPDCPDYSHIAVAASAGWAWGKSIGVAGAADSGEEGLNGVIEQAVKIVLEEHRCAVVDCIIQSI